MRGFVFVPVILTLAGVGDARGQSPKDGKPRDVKEIALACVLGEPGRLMTQRAEARALLSAMEEGRLYSATERGKLNVIVDRCQRSTDGVFHFWDERAKSSCVTAQKERVAVLEKKLAGLTGGMFPLPIFSLGSMAVGDAGLIGVYNVRIRQIIDENQMLVQWSSDPPFLVKVPTKGLVDDRTFPLYGFFVVSGTRKYETVVGGTNTVFVLEQVDLEWLRAEVKKRMPPSTISSIAEAIEKEKIQREKTEADRRAAEEKAEADKKAAETDRKAAIEEARWHTWTDSTGQYKTKALFGGMAGGEVRLIKRDGSTLRLPLEKLSEEDRQWIKNKSR